MVRSHEIRRRRMGNHDSPENMADRKFLESDRVVNRTETDVEHVSLLQVEEPRYVFSDQAFLICIHVTLPQCVEAG